MHVNRAIKDDEHFGAVIHVPLIGRIGPMQPDGRVADAVDIQRLPRGLAGEIAG